MIVMMLAKMKKGETQMTLQRIANIISRVHGFSKASTVRIGVKNYVKHENNETEVTVSIGLAKRASDWPEIAARLKGIAK